MRKLTMAIALASFVNTGIAQAPKQEKWIGTWILNKMKSGSGAPESATNTIEAIPGGIRVISQSVNARGETSRTEYAAKYDGTEVPVAGAAPDATATVTRIDDTTYEVVMKSQGTTTTARSFVSPDGKTRTVTQVLRIGNNEARLVLVYDRR